MSKIDKSNIKLLLKNKMKGAGTSQVPTHHPQLTKQISLQIWMNWDHKKNNKFGVITCSSTYIGCNNVTTFFFLTPSLIVLTS